MSHVVIGTHKNRCDTSAGFLTSDRNITFGCIILPYIWQHF